MALKLMGDSALSTLNVTSFRSVVTTRVFVATSAVVLAAFVLEILGPDKAKEIALKILDSWLLFLSAVLGINTVQKGIDRFSDRGFAESKARGAAQGAAAGAALAASVAAAGAPAGSPVTGERPAMRPSQAVPIPNTQVNVNVGGEEPPP